MGRLKAKYNISSFVLKTLSTPPNKASASSSGLPLPDPSMHSLSISLSTYKFPSRVRHEGRSEEAASVQVSWFHSGLVIICLGGILAYFLLGSFHIIEFHPQSLSCDYEGGATSIFPLSVHSYSTETLSFSFASGF